ncbi:immunoglobulin-like domain-containing protein [Listeria grandensis]|uniref:immunoglobulin-like domain-containing protein n=1 Tax=Listeria grandensis TaxID=1494963 RepID=UPI00055B9A27|nr:immunoglobulin-like domain-containing protein [Listeria grandensis]
MKNPVKKIVSVLTVTSILGTSIVTPFNVFSETPVKAASVSSKIATDAVLALFANNNPSTNVLKLTTDQQAIDAAQQLVNVAVDITETVRGNMHASINQAKDLLKIRNTPVDYSLFAEDADITSAAITGIMGQGITSVRLLIDGVVKANGTLNTDGTYSIPTNDFITQGSKVEVAGYNGTTEVARKTVKVSNNQKPLVPGSNETLAKTMASNAVLALFKDNPKSNELNPMTAQKTIDFAQNMINVVQTPSAKASLQQDLDKAQSLLNASLNLGLTVVPFKIGTDNYVTGQYSGDVAKISLTVNGVEGVKVPVTPSILKYYAKGVILKDTDNVTLTAFNKNGTVLGTKAVTIEKQQVTTGAITSINPFKIGTDNYITGKYSGDVAKISLTVNGVEGVKVGVTPPDLKYYAKNVILKDTDNVTLTAYDTNGRVLDTETVTLAKQVVTTGSITSIAPFVIDTENYITGQYSGDVAKISLTVDGVEGVKVPVTPPALKYYAKTAILNTTDNAILTAYDINGKVLDTKTVSLKK